LTVFPDRAILIPHCRNGRFAMPYPLAAATIAALVFAALPSPAVSQPAPCAARADGAFAGTPGKCLIVRSFGAAAAPQGVLVVVAHGDVSSGGKADYHFQLAKEIAAAHPQAAVYGLVRPGFPDGSGLVSEGSDNGRRDHYTAENIDAVAAAVAELRARTGAARVIGIGHSGGAATFGIIAGRNPGVLDGALLLACPCDIPRWRSANNAQPWPASLSPTAFVPGVSADMRVALAVGTGDSNTWPMLSEAHVAALKARGIPHRYETIPGTGHNMNGTMRAAALKILGEFLLP
jgi:predicted esterase